MGLVEIRRTRSLKYDWVGNTPRHPQCDIGDYLPTLKYFGNCGLLIDRGAPIA